jgi:hypothetical protein
MVGAINPNASTSIGYQRQRARDSAYMLNPGESFPPESPISSATPGPSSTPSSYAPASKPSTGKKNHNVSAGAIAGIVVATIGVIFLGALVFLMRHHNRALKQNHRHSTEPPPGSRGHHSVRRSHHSVHGRHYSVLPERHKSYRPMESLLLLKCSTTYVYPCMLVLNHIQAPGAIVPSTMIDNLGSMPVPL